MIRKKFQNSNSSGLKMGLWQIMLWKLGFYKKESNKRPPCNFSTAVKTNSFNRSSPYCVWINHSTFLIQKDNLFFLTDPIFSSCCSPIKSFGFRRMHKPAISLTDLPKIDFVLISHNHYDHLDKNSVLKLHKLYPEIKWIVPLNVKRWFLKNKITNIIELNWWESCKIKDLSIYAVPAQHFSGRILLDYNKTLWCGYVVELKDSCFYFAGDTGYNENDFKMIGQKWKKIDLSLIPIGGYLPRAVIGDVHVDPYQSVQIHKDVNSKFSMGMHWKTFKLSDENVNLPPYDLYLAMKKEKLDPASFITTEPGVYVNW